MGEVIKSIIEMQNSELISQLGAQADDNTYRIGRVSAPQFYSGGILSFIDDDGRNEILTKWKPLLDANGINITFAVVTNTVGNSQCLDFPALHILEKSGNDVVSHTRSHQHLNTLGQADLEAEFSESQCSLKNNGFKNYNILVYPYGGTDIIQNVKDTARKYYEYAFDMETYVNTIPIDNMLVQRVGDAHSLDNLKSILDTTVTNASLMVVVTHCWSESFDSSKIQALIDYAKSINVPIMKVSEALKYKGNVIGAGEFTADNCLYVGKDGRVNWSKGNYVNSKYGPTNPFTTLLAAYRKDRITYELIPNSKAADAPTAGVGGILTTYKFFDDAYAYQTYKAYTGKTIYMRLWAGSAWGTWS